MGCGASAEPEVDLSKVENVDLDAPDKHGMTMRQRQQMQAVKRERIAEKYKLDTLPPPTLTSQGMHPDSIPARSKDQIFENIKASVPSVFITVSAEVNINCLFVYPDQNWNEFPPTKLTRRNVDNGGSGAEGTAPPDWKCLRCQFKQFDKLEDQYNRWFETADKNVPGLRMIECAGPSACWATLSPHAYQQRWCLPDGRRAVSLLDTAAGIPTRLWNAYTREGCHKDDAKAEIFLRKFLKCLSDGLKIKTIVDKEVAETGKAPKPEVIKEKFPQEPGFDADIDKYLPILKEQMTGIQMGVWATVWELDPALEVVMEYMTVIEDAIMRNWFEVSIDAELDVDMWYYKRKNQDKGQEPDNVGGIKNWARKKVLSKGQDSCDDLLEEFKEQLHAITNKMMFTSLGGTENEKAQEMTDQLYPDMKEWVAIQARSIDAELIGVQARVKEAEECSTADLQKKMAEWKAKEDRPLEVRRQELYASVEAKIKEAHAAGGVSTKADGTEQTGFMGLSLFCRKPMRVERYFFKFRFICLFPMQTAEKKHKRPKTCKLVLWPERHNSLKQEIEMESFELPNGGADQVEKKTDSGLSKMTSGEDDIGKKEEKDPRVNWDDYDSDNFRGFTCLEEVAIDLPYAFHFQMDGKTFLGAHQPIEKDDDDDECYYRRVTFSANTRPYTINPLKLLGAVL